MAAAMVPQPLAEVTNPPDEDRAVAFAEHLDAGLVGRPDVSELVVVFLADRHRPSEDVLAESPVNWPV